MNRRVVSALIAPALAVAACGQAFTSAPGDGGALPVDDASLDTGAAGPDGAPADVAAPGDARSDDATSRDATPEDGGHSEGDASTGGGDGGSALPDAALCLRTCPAGFDCLDGGKCEDRAVLHFSATTNRPFNWSYGYAISPGGMFEPDSLHYSPAAGIDIWTGAAVDSLEPSVFHNGGPVTQTYAEMAIPAAGLGIYPGPSGEPSIVRWTAPVAGSYAIDVTFTGISTPATAVTASVLVNNTSEMGSSQALNDYGSLNTFTYSVPAQTLAAGGFIDFFVTTVTNRDDAPGGTALDARITAE
jgi:hypothetical protein